MHWKTISEIQEDYKNGNYTVSDLVSFYLNRIGKKNQNLNAYLSVWGDDVLQQASAAQERIEKKQARPLEGIPLAIKDNIMQKGRQTTAASHILETYTAVYSATVLKKLEAAGALILGKTNLDEFAMGASTEFSAFGPTKNPHDPSLVPGGSSDGSAAAVAADLCAASIGSDTGGSIRQPASFCGVVGFKPTYGRVSRYGLIAMTSSLDQIGPLTRSVEDARLLYDIISGRDQKDATTVDKKEKEYEPGTLEGIKIAIPRSSLTDGIDEDVRSVFDASRQELEKAGARIDEIDIPHLDLSLPVYYLLVSSEVSSNLARYDGIRYGTSADADSLIEQYIATRSKGFGDEAKRRIMLGTFTLSKGYRDKYYRQALRVRAHIQQEVEKALKEYDALLSPTSPTPPFALGEKFNDPLTMYLSDLLTVPANIANLPAISIPAGFSGSRPIGVQLMCASYNDQKLLALAENAESIIGQSEPPAAQD